MGVLVWDRRVRDYTQSTVSGTSGSGTLRLSRADRLYNQAMVRDAQHDPFTNGMLVRLEGADVAPEFRDLTDAALAERFLAITDEDVFASLVADVLTSELTSRRVLALIRQDGRVWQVAALNDHLEQWRPGGTQRTYAEMQKAGELGQRMSE